MAQLPPEVQLVVPVIHVNLSAQRWGGIEDERTDGALQQDIEACYHAYAQARLNYDDVLARRHLRVAEQLTEQLLARHDGPRS